MRITVKGHKLEQGDVTHISLVDRGANRKPFKILKAEQTEKPNMSILKALNARLSKGEQQTPAIAAYIVPKDDYTEVAKAALKALGVDVDNPVEIEEDGNTAIAFKQDAEDEDVQKDAIPLQGENCVVLIKGFNPYDMKSPSYTETVKTQGFMPSLSVANEALMSAIINQLYESDTNADSLVTKVDGVLGEFRSYVLGLCKSIPATAFKADGAVTEAIAAEVNKAEKKSKKAEADKKGKGKGADGEEDKDGKGKKDTTKKIDTNDIKQAISAVLGEAMGEVTKSVKAIGKQVDALAKKVDDVAEGQEEVKDTAEKALQTATKADKALHGKAITDADSDPDNDDEDEEDRVRKDEETFVPSDTALYDVRKKRDFSDRRNARQRVGR